MPAFIVLHTSGNACLPHEWITIILLMLPVFYSLRPLAFLPQAFYSLQLSFDLDREIYPMVVLAVVDEGDGKDVLVVHIHALFICLFYLVYSLLFCSKKW